jgi:hypothetical protein
MQLKNLLKKLETSRIFQNFSKQNPDNYFTTAFLILNLQNPTENQIQLDYFLPQKNQIAAFIHPFNQEPKIHNDIISVQNGQTQGKKIENMNPQSEKISLDIDNLEQKIKETIKQNNSSINPTKIIAILKDDVWNLTAMDNALAIIRIKINAQTQEIIDFNKGGLMDFMGIKKQS